MWKPVAIAAMAALIVAALGATVTDVGPWYQSLDKPGWQPPDWLFGPAWTLIFALTALSAAVAWRDAPDNSAQDAVIFLFTLNGLFNHLWSFLFFRLRRPDWAVIEVVLLWSSISLPIVVVARFSKVASVLLLPYLAWVTFAGILNLAIVKLNGPFANAIGPTLYFAGL
jgi:tryptophan-rich sensory protein